ncbi:MAG TPA: GNAT family N-acetyltransferase [Verrucomicrobiae bacterium]|nr:GNAT family N-acetyltransferase [Verrucomicrobiae bacterium]
MKSPPVIRQITAAETRPLRQAILRPHQRIEELTYPGDDAAATMHLGALVDGKLIGVASVYHEAPQGETDEGAWRLRGMAVMPGLHRKGIGSLLLRASIDYAKQRGGTMMWFNARTPAVPFYRAHGFQIRGQEFEISGIGSHYFMWKAIG